MLASVRKSVGGATLSWYTYVYLTVGMPRNSLVTQQITDEKKSFAPFIIVLVFVALLLAGFFFFDFKRGKNIAPLQGGLPAGLTTLPKSQPKNNPDGSPVVEVTGTSEAVTEIVKKVSKHIILPNGSVTVTTVIDPESLRRDNPDGFQLAKKGDKVLLYPDRAILYDEEVDLVVDVIRFKSIN